MCEWTEPRPAEKSRRCRVLYVSPLKALAVDVERNLRAPLTGIRHTAERLGAEVPEISVGVRSGDNYSSNGWTDPPTSERSEIAGPSFPNGTTIYCSYDTTFLAGSPHPSGGTNWFVWSQFHQDAGSISPPFELDLFGEQMGCTINVAGNQSNPSNYYVVKWTDASNIVRVASSEIWR